MCWVGKLVLTDSFLQNSIRVHLSGCLPLVDGSYSTSTLSFSSALYSILQPFIRELLTWRQEALWLSLFQCPQGQTHHHMVLTFPYEYSGGTGEIPQWLRALAILTENPGSIPSIYSTTIYNCSPMGSNVLSWSPGLLHTHDAYMHAAKSHTK